MICLAGKFLNYQVTNKGYSQNSKRWGKYFQAFKKKKCLFLKSILILPLHMLIFTCEINILFRPRCDWNYFLGCFGLDILVIKHCWVKYVQALFCKWHKRTFSININETYESIDGIIELKGEFLLVIYNPSSKCSTSGK